MADNTQVTIRYITHAGELLLVFPKQVDTLTLTAAQARDMGDRLIAFAAEIAHVQA
jgi:hypothetical protein